MPQCPRLLNKHSPETLASLQTHNGRCLVRGRETGGRGERRGKRSQEKKEGKKLTINICHQLELLTSLHIIIHTPSPPPPPHTHTHNLRVVGRSCPCVTMFSPSLHCLERQSSSSSSLPPAFNSWYSTVCVR